MLIDSVLINLTISNLLTKLVWPISLNISHTDMFHHAINGFGQFHNIFKILDCHDSPCNYFIKYMMCKFLINILTVKLGEVESYLLEHPSFSPDIASSDFRTYLNLEKLLGWKCLWLNEMMTSAGNDVLQKYQ